MMVIPIKLPELKVHIKADQRLVFQLLSAIGQGQMPGSEGSSKVLESNGDTMVAEFTTPVKTLTGRRSYRTVEEVTLYPSERITFHGLEGPLPHMQEEFRLEGEEGCTDLYYTGEFGMGYWVFGWLMARFYVRGLLKKTILDHMMEIKEAAESRAQRSLVFANTCAH